MIFFAIFVSLSFFFIFLAYYEFFFGLKIDISKHTSLYASPSDLHINCEKSV